MDQTSETEKALQRQKYSEIIEILLSAGYFRARIATLSEFDKVVGGLCWCITSSGESVDVDILFQENSTIGQRITLSETIVTALRRMGCPAQLQPHQIQGGVGGADYPAILNVIVWLVKKHFERRLEREEALRSYAVLQFSKNWTLPGERCVAGGGELLKPVTATSKKGNQLSSALESICDAERGKVVRQYKRRVGRKESEATRVHSCLLEYGESLAVAADGSGNGGGTDLLSSLVRADTSELSAFEKQLAKAAKDVRNDELAFLQRATREEDELMKQMQGVDQNGAISKAQLGSLVSLGADEISEATKQYQADLEESKKHLSNLQGGEMLSPQLLFQRQVQALNKQNEEISTKQSTISSNLQSLEEQYALLCEERDGAEEYIQQLQAQNHKLHDLEVKSTNQHELDSIKNLIAMNEQLRNKEADFKNACKTARQDIMDKIAALQRDARMEGPEFDQERAQQQEIAEMHAKVMSKYNKLRQLLAQVNLQVSSNARIIDDTPTRAELIQYERRFVELYQQSASKLEETRKYYDMYNTLDTTLGFIQKEIKLLNSISENFTMAMRTKEGRAEFSSQFAAIVKGVEESLKRQESNLSAKQHLVEDHKMIYQNLVEEQRRYYKAVKDFQDECQKNEWLSAKLEEMKVSAA